ncbi:helix-turn-helix domain-containing protein [Kitasatospora arboriphila]|uniref:Helix-turn-helix domain-containing protein n=1 Tax=Kitasatospora arboriphila TaxID=258052 RepID=A0ABP4E918_9ACTN
MPRRTASVTALPTSPSAEPLALPARFLTPEDVAALFGVPLETVYQWRRKRTGPPGFRAGRHVRYHPDAVARWVADQSNPAA